MDISCMEKLSHSATRPSKLAQVPPSPEARADAEIRWAALPAVFSWPVAGGGWRRRRWGYGRDWPYSEMERRSSSRKRGIGVVWVGAGVKGADEGGTRHSGLESGRLEIHTGKPSFHLAHRILTAGLIRAVMGSALDICCRMVMKKWICT